MLLDVVEGLELVFVRRRVGAEVVVFKGLETQFWGSAKAESRGGARRLLGRRRLLDGLGCGWPDDCNLQRGDDEAIALTERPLERLRVGAGLRGIATWEEPSSENWMRRRRGIGGQEQPMCEYSLQFRKRHATCKSSGLSQLPPHLHRL